MAIDYDREALRKILRDLTSDDPEFVRSFEADASPPQSAPDEHSDGSLVWISVFGGASVLALTLLTLGSLFYAMACAALAWFAATRSFNVTGNHREEGSEWP
jgi:hypothetical protein